MALLADFTNEIYDTSNAAFQDQGDSTKVFLGVLVTLLPKVTPNQFIKKNHISKQHFSQILPRLMPILMSDARIKEKFQDQEYLENVEHMFREKFIENLGVSLCLHRKSYHHEMTRKVIKNSISFYAKKKVLFSRQWFLWFFQVFENLILAWKDDSLTPEDLGLHPNHILAREDLIAGEPESFQYELLSGINFLKDRMQRSISGENDAIVRMANTIWNTANGIYQLVATYFNYWN